eukprot:scaffold41210_cov66-Phaeocystis_antarctica.AAC.10
MSWSGQWVGSSESSIACRPVCCGHGKSPGAIRPLSPPRQVFRRRVAALVKDERRNTRVVLVHEPVQHGLFRPRHVPPRQAFHTPRQGADRSVAPGRGPPAWRDPTAAPAATAHAAATGPALPL